MNPELATNGKDFTETWGGSSPDYPTDLPELFINPQFQNRLLFWRQQFHQTTKVFTLLAIFQLSVH